MRPLRILISLGLMAWMICLFILNFGEGWLFLLATSPLLVLLFEFLWLWWKEKSVAHSSLVRLFAFDKSRETDIYSWAFFNAGIIPVILFSYPLLFGESLAARLGFTILPRAWVEQYPIFAVLVAITAVTFMNYWIHRFEHWVPELWQLHKIHHSATEMTTLTTYRDHPLLTLFSDVCRIFLLTLMGLNALAVASLAALHSLQVL